MLKDHLLAEGFQTKLIAEMIDIRFLRNFAKFVKLSTTSTMLTTPFIYVYIVYFYV